jgi:hypothetical protein
MFLVLLGIYFHLECIKRKNYQKTQIYCKKSIKSSILFADWQKSGQECLYNDNSKLDENDKDDVMHYHGSNSKNGIKVTNGDYGYMICLI